MENIQITYVAIDSLRPCEYNPRKFNSTQKAKLAESIKVHGMVDPLLVNNALERENIVIGGNLRLVVLKELGYSQVPVVFLTIPELTKEKALNIRLNKTGGEFDLELLSHFDESFLKDIGFSSEELDEIFDEDSSNTETFDLKKELEKLNINNITVKKGQIYDLDGSRIMCGDSTIESHVLKLMGDEIARFNIFQRSVLGTTVKSNKDIVTDIRNYAKYILKEGTVTEKRELLANLRSRIVYKDKLLSLIG